MSSTTKVAELEEKLRAAFAAKTRRIKNNPSYEGDNDIYQNYLEEVQRLREKHPIFFSEIQEKNTNEKLDLLNKLDFGMDNYNLDPASAEGLSRLPFALNVPYGFSKHGLGGGSLGQTYSPDSKPRNQDRVNFTGAFSYQDKLGRGEVGIEEVLRHEAQHLVPKFDSEAAAYTMDNMYRDFNNKARRPSEIGKLEPSGAFLANLALYGMQNPNIQESRKDISEPEKFKNLEYVDTKDLANLKGADRVKFFNSIPRYEKRTAGGISRDLPNIGWFDELTNKIKGF